MGYTWNFLIIPGGLSHSAVHWALTASVVPALTHDSDVTEVHPAVLCVPYGSVPPERVTILIKYYYYYYYYINKYKVNILLRNYHLIMEGATILARVQVHANQVKG
jgi:hypothetical protein